MPTSEPPHDDTELMLDFVFTQIARDSCATTVNGWLWFCDSHVTHGNADTKDEAEFMGAMHEEYMRMRKDYECDGAIYVVFARDEGVIDELSGG
jgi:hypothetical protein